MENNGTTGNAAGENGSTAQEVSSTTQSMEPTKRSLRVQTWQKILENKSGVGYNSIFNRIPNFVDADKAAQLLAGIDEFKKAQHIKVNIDRALHEAKLQVLLAGKNLYLPSTRDSKALFLKVDVQPDATEEQKKEILHVQDVQQHRIEINLENKIKLDMVVIGSVVVSRDGYRIGRGNGFVDLDIGLLIDIGAITPQTVIVTIVHDTQVVDNLPQNLFQKYDTPVDIIITPTEVIRVAKRLPRPSGLFWELLSERRLKIVPVLQPLKESLEKSGKVIVLKEEDTDIEQHVNNRNRRRGHGRFNRRNNNRLRATSQTDNEQQGGDKEGQPKRQNNRRKRFYPKRFMQMKRRQTKSEGDQSGVEGKSQERKEGGENKKQKPRKNRPNRDFCVKLSNITRDVRVKDLKTELRKRECNPVQINWKGAFGKCYLHFGNRNGQPSTEDDINRVLKALEELSLTVPVGDRSNQAGGDGNQESGADGDAAAAAAPQQTKTINLSVELMKFTDKKAAANNGGGDNAATNGNGAAGDGANVGRIESVDTTTV